MKSMGIEELEGNVSRAIDEVRAGGEAIEITDKGEAIAMLVPVRKELAVPPDIEQRRAALAQLDALAEEIGKHMTEPVDVTETLREMRRY